MAKSSIGMYPQCQKHGISPEIIDKDLPELEHFTNTVIVELNIITKLHMATMSWLDTSSAGKDVPMYHRSSIYIIPSSCCGKA